MFVNLKTQIGKDFDLNAKQINGITIRGVDVLKKLGQKDTLFESDKPTKWQLDIVTPVMALCFSIVFNTEQEAIDFRDLLKKAESI